MWPEMPKLGFDMENALVSMFAARLIVTQALEARDKAGIKVRQPLASLSIPGGAMLGQEYLMVIASEVNVKQVVAGNQFALDTAITPELKEEGFVRDTIRAVQAFRKEKGMKPGETGTYVAKVSPNERVIVEKYLEHIQKSTHTTIEFE